MFTGVSQPLQPRRRSAVKGGLFILGIALACIALAACGPTQNRSTASAAAPPQNCGKVQIIANGQIQNSAAAKQAENCLWHAFQTCTPATLTVTIMGIDAGTTRTFSVSQQGSACVVTDRLQHYIVPKGTGQTTTYTCTGGITQQPDGLLFLSCGADGNIPVPPLAH